MNVTTMDYPANEGVTAQFAQYPSLRDKVIFVTGGGSGIGAALVTQLSQQGARVHFCDINDAASESLINDLDGTVPTTPSYYPCDLRNIAKLQPIIASVGEAEGRFDGLINNAAHDERHVLEDITEAYFDDRMAVNLRHQLFSSQSAARLMIKAGNGGFIINMGSITYMVGQGGMACYSAAKAAIWGLTRSLARDLGPDNIRVNMVVPGWIMTERQEDLWLDEESEQELMKRQVLKRKIYPDDVARMVLFLASDDSAACSAQSYIVDGGWV